MIFEHTINAIAFYIWNFTVENKEEEKDNMEAVK